jgi:voltage-gated potassium channel Kch
MIGPPGRQLNGRNRVPRACRMQSATKSVKRVRHYFRNWQERVREAGLTALLIIEVLLIFLVVPLTGMGLLPHYLQVSVFVLFVLATLVVTSRSHFATAVVVVCVFLSPLGSFAHAEAPLDFPDWLSAGGRLAAIATLSFVIARAVFGPGRVTFHRVQGAIVLYLNFGLFFFTIYRLMDDLNLNPAAFAGPGLPQTSAEFGSGAALLYFSFSTLTTLGYGDIVPLHPLVRNLANLEAVIGQLFPATLLARLVSLEIEHRRQAKSQ